LVSSSDIGFNWIYLDYVYSFIGKIHPFKRFDITVSPSDIRFNWMYLDYVYSFIGKFTLSKDSISQFPPLTLDLIGFILIFQCSLSGDFYALNCGHPVFSASFTCQLDPDRENPSD